MILEEAIRILECGGGWDLLDPSGSDADLDPLHEALDVALTVLREKQAERSGQPVVLPCKLGTRVYEVVLVYARGSYCDCCSATHGFESPCAYWDSDNWKCRSYLRKTGIDGEYGIVSKRFTLDMLDNFGKTVFLTREEAEETLVKKG